MMPLNQGQIQEYRSRSDERERALLPVSPDLNTRTVSVSLEPGRSPVPVYTAANIATSLVFHDSIGPPWPITSVTNDGPSFFQVLRLDLPDGNLLNVMPIQGYATSTLVVTLEGRDMTLVIRLESDSVRAPERKADALVLFRLVHHGPKASIPILKDIRETAGSSMLAFLDRVPPEKAVRVRVEPSCDDVAYLERGHQRRGKYQVLRASDYLAGYALQKQTDSDTSPEAFQVRLYHERYNKNRKKRYLILLVLLVAVIAVSGVLALSFLFAPENPPATVNLASTRADAITDKAGGEGTEDTIRN